MTADQELRETRAQAVAGLAELACKSGDEDFRQAADAMWAGAFQQGRLAALDEFLDRFCVCMKS